MGAIASQITSLTIVYSTFYSGADQRKHESSASLAFVRGIHRGPVNSPHKWPVTRKVFPFDDVTMYQLDEPYGFPDDHQAKCSYVSMSCEYWYLQSVFLFLYHCCILSEIKLTITTGELQLTTHAKLMSWHGNVFWIIGPLRGEPRVISGYPSQNTNNAELLCAIVSADKCQYDWKACME